METLEPFNIISQTAEDGLGDTVKPRLLEAMKDGILYSNILLKLYLKSLKNGGKLQLDEHIPYTAQMIATLTRHQIGTVEKMCIRDRIYGAGYLLRHWQPLWSDYWF